jgi:hypothetical protein
VHRTGDLTPSACADANSAAGLEAVILEHAAGQNDLEGRFSTPCQIELEIPGPRNSRPGLFRHPSMNQADTASWRQRAITLPDAVIRTWRLRWLRANARAD